MSGSARSCRPVARMFTGTGFYMYMCTARGEPDPKCPFDAGFPARIGVEVGVA